ncbi:MAG: alpha/beta hydrolase [Bacteroidetes bacterium]|nr:alpha/beta hydrolase [Bacteroidota bacterium]
MKKFVSFTIVIIFFALTINAYCQDNNFPFEVKKTGEGKQSLIFIPGFSCSGEVWNETTSVFEKDYTCYVLTMAGFAGVPPQSDPTFQSWEKGIAYFIEQFKIEKPVIIGHSMGGGLAMAIAADYPRLISKIVVVDALPCLAALMDNSFKSKDTNDCSAIISQITSATNEEFYQMQKKSVPQMLADTSKQTLVVDWSVKSDRKTLAEMYCDFSNTDLREKTALIECPALVLLESYFVNFKPALNEQFKNLKTANIQYATKGLHFIMYDDTEWFIEQLISFVKQ